MTATTILRTDAIDAVQLQQLQRADPDVRILDVRTGGEFATVHIPGSYNVPLDTLAEHAGHLAAVEHPLVLVCQSGARAARAHDNLAAAGKNTVHILEGGMASWQSANGDVVRGENGRWAMDRQVRLVAGSISLAGVLASLIAPRTKWIAAGVGAGLAYSAVSNTCAMAAVLNRLPYNQTDPCDIAGVLADLSRRAA